MLKNVKKDTHETKTLNAKNNIYNLSIYHIQYIERMTKSRKIIRNKHSITQTGKGIGKSKPEKPHTPPKKTRKNVQFLPGTKSPSSPKQNKTKQMFISKNKNRSKAVVQYENRQREQDLVDMMLGKIPLEGGNKRKTRRRKKK